MKQTQFFAVAVIALLAAGCRQESISVYDAPKEREVAAVAHQPHNHTPPPQGWEPAPKGDFRIESFVVKGTGDKKAEISVIPLPNMGGNLLDNVNRWRSQVGQKPLSIEDLGKAGTPVKVGGEDGKLYEVAGDSVEKDEPTRVLGVVVDRSGTGWYFKMIGDDKLVAAQKQNFLKYIEGYDFAHAGHAHGDVAASAPAADSADPHAGLNIPPVASAPAAASSGAAQQSSLPVPATWQQQEAGQMVDARFSVQGGKATMTVSTAGGSIVGNIQRWRGPGQVNLPTISDAEAEKLATPLDLNGVKATLVDLAGPAKRMVVVIVPNGATSTFYKLMGDPATVAAEKDALIEFAKKVK